jgi:hypothetical protein
VYIDGFLVENAIEKKGEWETIAEIMKSELDFPSEEGTLQMRETMVVVLAYGVNGRSAEKLLFTT